MGQLLLKMSRNSDKLNIIDQSAYQSRKNGNEGPTPRTHHSAKYKSKHRDQQQCTLFDFLIVPRQKKQELNNNKHNRARLNIARTSVAFRTKRKGKTRLQPKKRVTRLKRNIRRYRNSKQLAEQENKSPQHSSGLEDESEILQKQLVNELQKNLTICELKTEKNASLEMPISSITDTTTLEVTKDLNQLALEETKVTQPEMATRQLHSRRFRNYCDNCTSPRLKELTNQLLKDLDRFQKRAFAKNEIKARAHPRLIVGFREALCRLRINKVKLLFLATDCEMCPGEGGLDGRIEELKSVCLQQNVPYCFSLMRREMAYAIHKRAQVSCVSILDYDGANDTFKQLLLELENARIQYRNLTAV